MKREWRCRPSSIKKKMMERLAASAAYLKSHRECTGKIGVVGFCYGGGVANNLAVRMPDPCRRRCAFYGMQPSAEDVAQNQSASAHSLTGDSTIA